MNLTKCHLGFEKTLGHIRPQVSVETQSQAAFEVLKRTVPERAQEFSLEVNPNLTVNGKDSFQVIVLYFIKMFIFLCVWC